MKKLLTMLLTVVMAVACCFGLTACGEDEAKARTIDINDDFAMFAEYVPNDFKIGFIFLHDEKSTYDLNFLNAAKEAVAVMGLKAEQVIYKVNVPEGQECYDAAKELKEAGCKAIFANSFGHGGFMLQAAKDFTDVQFYHATGAQASNLPEGVTNFHNAFASIYEGRYLGGIAAGMKLNEMVKAQETAKGSPLTEDELKAATKMGYVGAYPYAEVKSGYTAFYLGAKSVCPTVTMDVKFTNSWYDEVAEKAAAEALIADGAKLISQHADSMGAPSACEKAGVPNVSYNGTTIKDCPNTFIVSSRIDWSIYFKLIISTFAVGEEIEEQVEMFKEMVGKDFCYGLSSGSVKMSAINADVMAEGTVAALQQAIRKLESAYNYDVETGNMYSASAGIVFNCANFTVTLTDAQKAAKVTVDGVEVNQYQVVDGRLVAYYADVIDEGDFKGDTNVIKLGMIGGEIVTYFDESNATLFRSAPYFDIDIDGITIK